MSIKYIFIIALAAAAFSTNGCAEVDQKRDQVIEVASTPEPMLTSTVTSATPEPAPVELPKPAVVHEEPKTPEVAFEPTVDSVGGVTIQRFLTTSAIVQREPGDLTTTFGPHHERVYAFVEVSNESEADKSLFVHFIGPKGKVSGGVELEIPASAPRWRTWAYTRYFDAPGLWRVEIRDAEGSPLGALPFEVEPSL
jgi:hypothetical protein